MFFDCKMRSWSGKARSRPNWLRVLNWLEIWCTQLTKSLLPGGLSTTKVFANFARWRMSSIFVEKLLTNEYNAFPIFSRNLWKGYLPYTSIQIYFTFALESMSVSSGILNSLTKFRGMLHFYTPWKHQPLFCFHGLTH